MCKKSLFALIIALPVLFACGGGSRRTDAEPQERRVPELIAAVPSDALAVICYDHCLEGLALYDSTSVLHRLDLSAFKNNRMALSLGFNGSLVPVLALDTGRAPADSTEAVVDLLAQAATLRLSAEYFHPDEEARRDGFLLITPSEAQMTAVKRHLSEHTNILDAPGFRQALATADAAEFVILRNGGAERLAPKDWLQGVFPRRDLTSFLGRVADWTVLKPVSGGFTVLPVCGAGDDAYYANILATLPFGDSRLGTILPQDTRFALAMPVSQPEMRQAVERYQDASVKLTRYKRTLEELRKASGKDPVKWEKELGIREIARVHFEGGAVALVRPAKAVEDREPAENPWRGFLSILYGSAFGLADDTHTAAYGGWYLYGNEAALRAFLDAERPDGTGAKWPGRGCRFLVYQPDKTLAWDKKGIRLTWNSNR